MKKFFSQRKLNIIFSAAAIIIMWLVWIIAYYAVGNDYVIPSFSDTMSELWEYLKYGTFWTAFFNTLGRTFLAFILSFALAVILASASALSKSFRAFFKPLISFLRTLPTLAVILLLLIWTNPKTAPVIVTVLVLFPMIYSQILAAVGGIDEGLTEMAKVYNLGKGQRLFKIYLPVISPNILAQTGSNISLAIKVMISAEVMSNTYQSLGGMMQYARLYIEMPRLAALTIAAVAIGLLLDILFSQLTRITDKWAKKEGAEDGN